MEKKFFQGLWLCAPVSLAGGEVLDDRKLPILVASWNPIPSLESAWTEGGPTSCGRRFDSTWDVKGNALFKMDFYSHTLVETGGPGPSQLQLEQGITLFLYSILTKAGLLSWFLLHSHHPLYLLAPCSALLLGKDQFIHLTQTHSKDLNFWVKGWRKGRLCLTQWRLPHSFPYIRTSETLKIGPRTLFSWQNPAKDLVELPNANPN